VGTRIDFAAVRLDFGDANRDGSIRAFAANDRSDQMRCGIGCRTPKRGERIAG